MVCIASFQSLSIVLGKRDLDLLVVDWKDDSSSDVVRTVRNGACRKTTIAALWIDISVETLLSKRVLTR